MGKPFNDDNSVEPATLSNIHVAAQGWVVIAGLAVSEKGAGADMSVDVAVGGAVVDGVVVTKGSVTNVAITAADGTDDRLDLVVMNSSGTISIQDGTAADPTQSSDYDLDGNSAILLAIVEVPANDTTIEDAQIRDQRVVESRRVDWYDMIMFANLSR